MAKTGDWWLSVRAELIDLIAYILNVTHEKLTGFEFRIASWPDFSSRDLYYSHTIVTVFFTHFPALGILKNPFARARYFFTHV